MHACFSSKRTGGPGVKILMSGGTRCNITNARGLRRLEVVSGPIDPAYDRAQSRGIRAIQQAFGDNGAFLGPRLRRFDVDATVRMFEDAGVATKIEGNGKIFPVSDRATDVLDALVRRLERSGASSALPEPRARDRADRRQSLAETGFQGHSFRMRPSTARRVIVAVGGASYPGCGTTGDGYAIARRFGHTIVDPRPALVPLRVAADWVPELERAEPAGRGRVGPFEHQRAARRSVARRCCLLTSGSAARRSSTSAGRSRAATIPEPLIAPSRPGADRSSRRARPSAPDLLPPGPPRLWSPSCPRSCRAGWPNASLSAAAIPAEPDGPGPLARRTPAAARPRSKALSLPILGTLGFEKAEVTSGGVALDEVDPKTLESRLVPGLYFAGEVLDLDGLIGGYNFQAAWSTGWLAGETAATRE